MPYIASIKFKKITFLTGMYMDWLLEELLNKGSLEVNEISKKMRIASRRKREQFLLEHGLVSIQEYKDSNNRNRKRLIVTDKGKIVIKELFILEKRI